METKVDKKFRPNRVVFFPYIFKPIGLVVAIAGALAFAWFKWLKPPFIAGHEEAFELYMFNLSLMGVFLLVWSRERFEDEMIHEMKLRALSLSFHINVFWQLIPPLFLGSSELLGQTPGSTDVQEFILELLCCYLFLYYAEKWITALRTRSA